VSRSLAGGSARDDHGPSLWQAGGGVGRGTGCVAPRGDRQGARGRGGGHGTPVLAGLYGCAHDRPTDARTGCRALFARTGDSRPERVFWPGRLSSHDDARVLSFRPLELRGLLSGTPAAPSRACGGLAAGAFEYPGQRNPIEFRPMTAWTPERCPATVHFLKVPSPGGR